MKYISKLWKTRKLMFDLISGFSLLILITILAITVYTFKNNSKSFIELSDELVSNASITSVDNTIDYFNKLKYMSELTSYNIENISDVKRDNKKLILYLIGVLRIYPEISNIYLGATNGNFLSVIRVNRNSTYATDKTVPLPGGLSFIIQFIDRSGAEPLDYRYYTDDEGTVREEEVIKRVFYDPRARPWYLGSQQKQAFYWTDLYRFDNGMPGITASIPLYTGVGNSPDNGEFFGVFGVDISENDIKKFVEGPHLGKAGTVFIVDTQGGELIAYNDRGKKSVEKNTPQRTEIKIIHELADEKIVLSFQQHINKKEDRFNFIHDNVSYLAHFRPFPKEFGKPWELGIVSPTDTFLGSLKDTQSKTILMSILIFALSLFLIFLFAKKITRPIILLTEEANKIKEFKLDDGVEVKSSVYEIALLNQAISTMRTSLQAFSMFVPKGVVKKLMGSKTDVKIGGGEKPLTLMFTDIENFTTVTEKYPPEKLFPHLSDYFEALTPIIQENKGTLDKYIGDAIMAFWGAPSADQQQALHACTAALGCQKKLLGFNRKARAEKKPELATRIGLHTGMAIVGNVGSADRVNYTVIGDAVNLAARLEGVNKLFGTKIIMSEEVYQKVHKNCVVRPLDVVAVKGKEKGVKIYELIGLKKGDPNLFPSRNKVQFAEMFTQGFKVYLERRWDEAIGVFQEINQKFGSDQTCNMYIERCENFKKTPPPKKWDGLVQLEVK